MEISIFEEMLKVKGWNVVPYDPSHKKKMHIHGGTSNDIDSLFKNLDTLFENIPCQRGRCKFITTFLEVKDLDENGFLAFFNAKTAPFIFPLSSDLKMHTKGNDILLKSMKPIGCPGGEEIPARTQKGLDEWAEIYNSSSFDFAISCSEGHYDEVFRYIDGGIPVPKKTKYTWAKNWNLSDSGASFSKCRKYRYQLYRCWDREKPMLSFIGLNPSTANETTDDPTVRKMKKFAMRLGYGGIHMLNLFAIISPYPGVISNSLDPVGPKNDYWLRKRAEESKDIIFGWGAFPEAADRAKVVIEMFPKALALKINKNGSPGHPLYLRDASDPFLFRRE